MVPIQNSFGDELLIAAVVPCFRARRHISDVLRDLTDQVDRIYLVDDACPEQTGIFVTKTITDSKVTVLFHEKNSGVGGAVCTGYKRAIADGADIIVKIDGDGQMDTSRIPNLLEPILLGEADYSKGNRFYGLIGLKGMPWPRLLGNSLLSLLSKFSSGYWNILDPTNGFTAIHADAIHQLAIDDLDTRFFFESDLLYHLNSIRAVVVDIPIPARYLGESSNLQIRKVSIDFPIKHAINLFKRIYYSYFIHNLNIASLELFAGTILFILGMRNGLNLWLGAGEATSAATSGTVMLAALPLILGTQFLLAFFSYDMQSVPKKPIHKHQNIPPPFRSH